MGWTLRSTSPDFSGASQKQRHHLFHPGPQMWEGESWGAGKVGGERPRLRGAHSAALQGSRLFFPVLSLLHLCLSPCLSLSFSVSALVSLSVPIFASVCFSDCPVLSSLSLCFCHSASPYLCLSVSISLRVPSCLLVPLCLPALVPAVTRVAPRSQRGGQRQASAQAGLGRSPRRGVSKGGAASPAARAGGGEPAVGPWGRSRPRERGAAFGRGMRPVASP